MDASPTLRSKKDLIEEFVDRVSLIGGVDDQWKAYITERSEAELSAIIDEERLKDPQTRTFVRAALRDGAVSAQGTAITTILPPASRFSPQGDHAEKKRRVIDKLTAYVERFLGLGLTRDHQENL